MFTSKPVMCAHCEHSEWTTIRGSRIESHLGLWCTKTCHEAKNPCGYFEKVDLRKNLKPGESVVIDGVEYKAIHKNP